jgi:hypothetical protein
MARKAFDPSLPIVKAVATASALLPPPVKQLVTTPAQLQSNHVELFRIVGHFDLGPARLAELRKAFPNIVADIETVLAAHGLHSMVLGSKDAAAAAERLLDFLAHFGIRAETQLKFDKSVRGYRSNVAGAIMEWLVEANDALRADILTWATTAFKDLNDVVLKMRGQIGPLPEHLLAAQIVNAHNAAVAIPTAGLFGEPLVASDIFLRMPDGMKRKFVDGMTVSLYRAGAATPSLVAPTTLGEYKFNTAIRKAAKQIEDAPGRLVDAEALVFTAGGEVYTFKPEQVVFMAGKSGPDLNQYVVTHIDPLITAARPKALYTSAPDQLLGSQTSVAPPQLTPFTGRANKVHAVLVEFTVDSRFVLQLVDVLIGPPR